MSVRPVHVHAAALLAALALALSAARAGYDPRPATPTAAPAASATPPAPAPPGPPVERVHDLSFLEPERPESDALRADAPRPERGIAMPRPSRREDGPGRAGGAGGGGAILRMEDDPPDWVDRAIDLARDLEIGAGEGESLTREGAAVRARLGERGHALLAALVDGLRVACDRRVALELDLVALSPGDPIFDPTRQLPPGVIASGERARILALASGRPSDDASMRDRPAASASRARAVWSDRRRARLGATIALRRTRAVSWVEGFLIDQTGTVPVVGTTVSTLEAGVEAVLSPALAPDGRSVRMCIRALETSLEALESRQIGGAEVDFPVTAAREVASRIDIPDGGAAAIVLGPALRPAEGSGEESVRVLLVRARLEPARPGAAPARVPALEGAEEDEERVLDVGGLLPEPGDPGRRRSLDAVLNGILRRAGEEGVHGIRVLDRALALRAVPASMRRLEKAVADLGAEEPRVLRIDATIAVVEMLPGRESGAGVVERALAAGPAIDRGAATALLARAAEGWGLTRIATFTGGATEGSSAAFCTRLDRRYVAGVEACSGGVEGRVETVRAPAIDGIESGFSLEVKLRSGPPGAMTIDVAGVIQTVEMMRRASAPLPPHGDLSIELPSVQRSPFGGRVELPAEGGAAVFSAGRALEGLDGEAADTIVVVRVSR